MRYFFGYLSISMLPFAALAQSYSNAPLLVVTPQMQVAAEKPPTAEMAAIIAPSAAAPTSSTATPSAVPAAADSAPGKLWPRDTVPIFMTSCTKLKVELVDPCSCIITKVVAQFTHDEFLKMDAAGTLGSDPKMQEIRQQCVDSALADKKRPANPGAQ